MGVKKEAASLTRECITTALFMLTEEKPYSEITITDIAERAGVSRMAYYRNYKSKDDIILKCLGENAAIFSEKVKNGTKDLRNVLTVAGGFFYDNIPLINAIINADLGNEAMGYMYSALIGLFPAIAGSRENEYNTAFYVGAVVSVFRVWMMSGMKEDVSEIVDIILNNISDEIEKKYEGLEIR